MYQRSIKLFFMSFACAYCVIGAINFVVDPGAIYLNKILFSSQIDSFSKQILNSKYGVLVDNLNDREIKVVLAKQASKYDCVIVGSSHVVGISSVRNIGNINKICKNVLNLGVDGGGLEDIAIFSYLILNQHSLPKKIFIGIDPWTIKFNMDDRFRINENIYNKMLEQMNMRIDTHSLYYYDLFTNLFNFEYFLHSLNKITSSQKSSQTAIFDNNLTPISQPYDFINGYANGLVMLSDGSRVYQTSELKRYQEGLKALPAGGDSPYKIGGKVYDKNALNFFIDIVNNYQTNDVKVSIITTPYHAKIFLKKNITWAHIDNMSSLINKISTNLNLKIYGSYYPDKLGCKDNEFIDFMHAHTGCLNKINFDTK